MRTRTVGGAEGDWYAQIRSPGTGAGCDGGASQIVLGDMSHDDERREEFWASEEA